MTVFLDTSFIWALLDRRDTAHRLAIPHGDALASGEQGVLLTSDYVYDEAISLCRRSKARVALAAVDGFFFDEGRPFHVARVDSRCFDEARRLMLADADRPLSFTDWTTIVLAKRHRAGAIATFDDHLGDAYGKAIP